MRLATGARQHANSFFVSIVWPPLSDTSRGLVQIPRRHPGRDSFLLLPFFVPFASGAPVFQPSAPTWECWVAEVSARVCREGGARVSQSTNSFGTWTSPPRRGQNRRTGGGGGWPPSVTRRAASIDTMMVSPLSRWSASCTVPTSTEQRQAAISGVVRGGRTSPFVVRGEIDEKTDYPDHLWPELWKSMGKNAKLKEKQKWFEEKLHLENDRKLEGSISSTRRTRNSREPSRTRVRSWKLQWLLLCPVKF